MFADFIFYVMLLSLLGAKLWLLLTNLDYYLKYPGEIKYLLTSGGTFYGGLIFGAVFAVWFIRRHRLSYRQLGDIAAPALALGHFFGRLGCFAAGCCWGREAGHFPLAVTFSSLKANALTGVPLYIPLYPTQLMEAALNLGNFLVPDRLYKKRKFKGQVLALYILNYSADPLRGRVFPRRPRPGLHFRRHGAPLVQPVVAAADLHHRRHHRPGPAARASRRKVNKKITFKVREHWERIDHYLTAVLQTLSRSQIEKLIRNGQVTLNGAVAAQEKPARSFPTTAIVVEIESEEETVYLPSRPLRKLFEDEWLLVIDKPSGLPVHPGAGEKQETVLDIFRYHYPQIDDMADQERPGIVHRLDKDTSGVLILAKSEEALERMQELFQEREMQKTYLALVKGRMRFRNGTIDLPLARSLKNRARFEVVGRGPRGQARRGHRFFRHPRLRKIHLRAPDAADRPHPPAARPPGPFRQPGPGRHPVRQDRKGQDFPRLALHAHRIEFVHPFTGNGMRVTSPLPADLRQYMSGTIYQDRKVGRPGMDSRKERLDLH